VFQHLVSELDRRLQSGTLPVPDPGGRTTHPAFPNAPRRLESIAGLMKRCGH